VFVIQRNRINIKFCWNQVHLFDFQKESHIYFHFYDLEELKTNSNDYRALNVLIFHAKKMI
jgi:hypothetical protein